MTTLDNRPRVSLASEPGVIMGPSATGEMMAVREVDGDTSILGYAIQQETVDAVAHIRAGGSPRSMTEYRMWSVANPVPAFFRRAEQ